MPRVTGRGNYGMTAGIKTRKTGTPGANDKSSVNQKRVGPAPYTMLPSGGAGFGLSSAQTSGKVIRSRPTGMNIAGPDGGLAGMPYIHSANNMGGKHVGREMGVGGMEPGKKIAGGNTKKLGMAY